MPTPTADSNGSVGGAAKRVADHASAIARLELELAAVELKKKAAALGIGIGLAVAAGLMAFFMIGFAFATLAAVLATFLDVWLALLIVTLFLGLLAVVNAYFAKLLIQRGTPPVPEQAVEEAKLTTAALKR
jgi:uncharacterized membrane protein YqjE